MSLIIGIPKEHIPGETRVAMSPNVASKLVNKGFSLCIEGGAGLEAGYHDDQYRAAGVEIVDRARALACDLVATVRKPSLEDVAAMKAGAVWMGLLEACDSSDEVLQALFRAQVRPLAMERIPRISRAQAMDVLSSQANIAGYRAVIEAAARYGRFFPLMMTAAGSVKPARVVVLGAGVAGLQAIATARRLGAEVYAYDVRPGVDEQIRAVGGKPIELDIGEDGAGEGGFAKELSDEAKAKQQALLADELAQAHVIITTARIPCRPAPILVTESVVKRMREGSVIVDLAAAEGGNCPLTEADKVVRKHGVILVGHTNYPAMMASDASDFYAHNIANFIEFLLVKENDEWVLKDLEEDEISRAALVKPST